MRYASIKLNDIANGPGVRVSLFVQGCEFHCTGCFNPETWSFKDGDLFDNGAFEQMADHLSKPQIKGVSILGGEPLHRWNVGTVLKLVYHIKELFPDKSIWLYSGYKFEDMNKIQRMVLEKVDVLVDGQFEEENKVIDLRFRGSTNQRIIDVQRSLEADKVVLWVDENEVADESADYETAVRGIQRRAYGSGADML